MSTAGLDGGGIMLHWCGGVYLGILRLDCFGRVAVGKLGAVADSSRRVTHRRSCDFHDSGVLSDLLVCVLTSVTETFSVGLDSSGTRVVSFGVRWYEWRARCGDVVEMSWYAARRPGSWGWVTGG